MNLTIFYFDFVVESGIRGDMYFIFGRAVILIVGLWWCKVVLGRLPSDIREFKDSDYTGKIAIVTIWLLTVCIIIWLVIYIMRLISNWTPYF